MLILKQPITTTFVSFRPFYAYFLFFPVIWSVGTADGVRKIIYLWTLLTVFGVLLYFFQFFFGGLTVFARHDWLYSNIKVALVGGGVSHSFGFRRVMSPGTVVFRTMLFVAISSWLLLDGKQRWLWGGLAALIGFQVIIQFTRGMYLTTLAVLLLLPFLIGDRRGRQRLIALYGVVLVLGVMVVVFKSATATHAGGVGLFEFAKERLMSGLIHTDADASIQGRVQAWTYFTGALKGHWLFGLGFGEAIVYGDNTYLSFLIKTGIVGTCTFVLLYGVVAIRGWRHYREIEDSFMKAVYLGLWLSTVRHFINGITQSDFASWERIPVLIVAVAVMEVIISHAQRQREEMEGGDDAGKLVDGVGVLGGCWESGAVEATAGLPTNRSVGTGS